MCALIVVVSSLFATPQARPATAQPTPLYLPWEIVEQKPQPVEVRPGGPGVDVTFGIRNNGDTQRIWIGTWTSPVETPEENTSDHDISIRQVGTCRDARTLGRVCEVGTIEAGEVKEVTVTVVPPHDVPEYDQRRHLSLAIWEQQEDGSIAQTTLAVEERPSPESGVITILGTKRQLSDPSPEPTGATVSASVVDDETGETVRDALVEISGPDGRGHTARTNAAGTISIRFDQVTPGERVTLTVRAGGYETATKYATPDATGEVFVSVRLRPAAVAGSSEVAAAGDGIAPLAWGLGLAGVLLGAAVLSLVLRRRT